MSLHMHPSRLLLFCTCCFLLFFIRAGVLFIVWPATFPFFLARPAHPLRRSCVSDKFAWRKGMARACACSCVAAYYTAAAAAAAAAALDRLFFDS